MNDDQVLPPPPEPLVADHPEPLIPAAGHGIVAERLVSMNGLISLVMLIWSAVVLRNPALFRARVARFGQQFPWLVGTRRQSSS
jgi:hypothetical protein